MWKRPAVCLSLVLILAAVAGAWLVGAQTSPSVPTPLSHMTQEQQLEYLRSQGIEVPEAYTQFVLDLIPLVEEDPGLPIAVSNPIAYQLGVDVREAVNQYSK